MRKSLLLLAAPALVLIYTSCKSGDAINLKLNLQPGSQYVYTMDMKTATEQSVMKMQQDMTMEFTYDVAAGTGSDRLITVSYDRMAMNMATPMGNMGYDSKDPSKGDPRLAMIGGMLHKPFTMEVTEQGDIKKINGLDAILNGMGDPSTEQGAAMRQQMAQSFNDTAIRSLMQQSLNIFPDHPVRPGDTWKKTYNMNVSMMNMAIDNEFKLVSVKGNIAQLEANAKIKGGGGATGPEMKNMKIDLSGDQKGTLEVEVSTGLVTDSKTKQTIKGDISSDAMKMKVPISIVSDIHLSAKKK